MLDIVARSFPLDPAELLPAITPDSAPFWSALGEGRVIAQSCTGCGRFRFPIRPVCPHCGQTGWQWGEVSETGTVFSYVRYVRSYLPEFADVMPYVVACVEFPERIRMFGWLKNAPAAGEIAIGRAVRAEAERWPNGRCVLHFLLQT